MNPDTVKFQTVLAGGHLFLFIQKSSTDVILSSLFWPFSTVSDQLELLNAEVNGEKLFYIPSVRILSFNDCLYLFPPDSTYFYRSSPVPMQKEFVKLSFELVELPTSDNINVESLRVVAQDTVLYFSQEHEEIILISPRGLILSKKLPETFTVIDNADLFMVDDFIYLVGRSAISTRNFVSYIEVPFSGPKKVSNWTSVMIPPSLHSPVFAVCDGVLLVLGPKNLLKFNPETKAFHLFYTSVITSETLGEKIQEGVKFALSNIQNDKEVSLDKILEVVPEESDIISFYRTRQNRYVYAIIPEAGHTISGLSSLTSNSNLLVHTVLTDYGIQFMFHYVNYEEPLFKVTFDPLTTLIKTKNIYSFPVLSEFRITASTTGETVYIIPFQFTKLPGGIEKVWKVTITPLTPISIYPSVTYENEVFKKLPKVPSNIHAKREGNNVKFTLPYPIGIVNYYIQVHDDFGTIEYKSSEHNLVVPVNGERVHYRACVFNARKFSKWSDWTPLDEYEDKEILKISLKAEGPKAGKVRLFWEGLDQSDTGSDRPQFLSYDNYISPFLSLYYGTMMPFLTAPYQPPQWIPEPIKPIRVVPEAKTNDVAISEYDVLSWIANEHEKQNNMNTIVEEPEKRE